MTRLRPDLIVLALLAASAANAASSALSPADTAAAYRAAGFVHKGASWTRCDDGASASYASSVEAEDLNGDGAPEAWVRESSTMCYGATGEAFVLLTKKGGAWVPLLDEVGMAAPRKTKHLGWPDIEVGGPGMGPFPVYRFNGTKYASR